MEDGHLWISENISWKKEKSLKKPHTLGAWNRQFSSYGSELEVVQIKKIFEFREIYTDMRFRTKKIGLYPLKWLLRSLRIYTWVKSPIPLELNWRFKAPKVRGIYRHKSFSFMKCFHIFINFHLPIFKKKFF